MSAAWLAHAPPPPPSTAVRKPRRSSSYEPMSVQKGSVSNDLHTRGGYLPPSSHSPEPPSSRRNSVSDLKETAAAAASTSRSSSPVKRVRSKVSSSPMPPAPSAYYNYQHQLQQQKQQLYHQQQTSQMAAHQAYAAPHDASHAQVQAPPTSAAMSHSYSETGSAAPYPGFARERRDSAPAGSYMPPQSAQSMVYAPPQPHQNGVVPMHSTAYAPTGAAAIPGPSHFAAQPPIGYIDINGIPASHLQFMPSHNGTAFSTGHYGAPAQQHQQWAPAPQIQPAYQQTTPSPYYPTMASPPVQHPWDPSQSGVVVSSPQHASITGAVSPVVPSSANAPNTHVFPPMHVTSPPMPATSPHPACVTDLSRQSTSSSVGSVRRPLPQPSRTSSNPSAPGSPVIGPTGLANRGSVRRDLPRPPSGSSATISAASSYVSSNLSKSDGSNPASPTAGTTSRLPPTALNRTESVRLAAEALMARGVPQRRPLRSALASTTFSPPMPATRMVGSPLNQHELPASQSEPVAARNGAQSMVQPHVETTAASTEASHRASQSAGSALHDSVDSSPVRSRGALPDHTQPQNSQRAPTSAPARFQDAMQQSGPSYDPYASPPQPTSQLPHQQPARYEETSQLVDSMAGMSMNHQNDVATVASPTSASPTIPVFTFDAPEEEPEKPRRRRGSSVSRAGPPPGRKVIQQAVPSSTVPTIVLPGDDDDEGNSGPSIQISGADDSQPPAQSGPTISVTADDDDTRSQTSTGSRGPSISVSFSAEPSAKSQRAGTSHSPSSTTRSSLDQARVSASSVGSGSGCHGCHKWIAGKVVHALGTTFHPSCFVCAHCAEGLEHVAFYEHDGLPYCHFDYHELFSKRCFHCRTPIVDERYITVADEELTGRDGETHERCYHELHFFCANCGDPFLDPKAAGSVAGSDPGLMTADENGKVKHGGMEFIVHKGYPYCERCHVNLHKPRCKECKKPITEDLIAALGGKYHPECFTCWSCRRPFEDTQFFVKDGKAYDEACYKVLLRNMI